MGNIRPRMVKQYFLLHQHPSLSRQSQVATDMHGARLERGYCLGAVPCTISILVQLKMEYLPPHHPALPDPQP